ncbi:Hypothetical predicted protein [Mytilus galloprovincialis]|uniref:Uncharacterized protein n=1 Tax=Mytilus galloprovincialis TaxID=29158 RepID=A0A8B6GDK4_MYTGA|nr:Hypothetical predicted protein [Mytilus galloprovincialis]
MAKYHQKWLCGQMMTSLGTFSENFLYAGDEASKGQEIELVEMNAAQKLCIQETFPHIESVFVTKQIMPVLKVFDGKREKKKIVKIATASFYRRIQGYWFQIDSMIKDNRFYWSSLPGVNRNVKWPVKLVGEEVFCNSDRAL